MTRIQQVALIVLIPLVIVVGLFVGQALREDNSTDSLQVASADDVTAFEHDYTIPPGTADRIEAGEEVEVVPRELTVQVGESIRIVNHDDVGHVVGVFYVGAGETITKRFTSPGELTNECTVHSDGVFTLRVEE